MTSDGAPGSPVGRYAPLAVLSCDVMSSCAYATESTLRILVAAAGVAAFALVTPVTLLLLVLLVLLVLLGVACLCYRQVGISGSGLLPGVPSFILLRAFASGGPAMTGMEAISNAVSVLKEPQVRNARTTLVLMATILGVMFVAESVMAALTHAVPFLGGTPTVLSEIGRAVFGGGATGAGTTRYHLRRRGPHRGRQITVGALALVASAAVTAIFVATTSTRGAWLVVAIPSLVLLLTRTHHRYEAERELLAGDLAVLAPAGRVRRHHVVVVPVDRLDLSTARALPLAGSLTSSGDVRAVHFALDAARAERIAA